MKKSSSAEVEQLPNLDDLLRFVGASGNTNILFGHISKLQYRLDLNQSLKRNIVTDTDYFCWLLLYSNYIITRLESLYQMRGENRSQDKGIKDLVKLFIAHLEEENISIDKDRIYCAVELRHTFFHFGAPNLIRVKMDKKLKGLVERCLKDYEFAKQLLEEIKELTLIVPSHPIAYKNSIQIG